MEARPPAWAASPGRLRLHFQYDHGMLLLIREPFNELYGSVGDRVGRQKMYLAWAVTLTAALQH